MLLVLREGPYPNPRGSVNDNNGYSVSRKEITKGRTVPLILQKIRRKSGKRVKMAATSISFNQNELMRTSIDQCKS